MYKCHKQGFIPCLFIYTIHEELYDNFRTVYFMKLGFSCDIYVVWRPCHFFKRYEAE